MSAKFTSYALLGTGRVAHHFQHYFNALHLPVHVFSARELRLRELVGASSHLLFAVSDDALAGVTRPWLGGDKTLVHFSGAVNLPGVFSVHPLMTFGPKLEGEEWYRRIPLVIEPNVNLADILPGVPNPAWVVDAAQRPLYHALVSLAGNSAFLLWRAVGDEMEKNLGLPRRLLTPFLHQVVANAAGDEGATGFTGPVARGDWGTVGEHLHALGASRGALLNAYRAYLRQATRAGHSVPEEML